MLKQQMTDCQSISQSVRWSVSRSVSQSVSPKPVGIQKAKPQPNHTACATVRNWRNWTIIIKYHHFVTIKGIWKSFFPPISLLVLLCRRLLFFFLIQYRNSRTNQSRVETGSLWWGGGLLVCLCYLPPTSLRVIKWMLEGQSDSSGCCSIGRE